MCLKIIFLGCDVVTIDTFRIIIFYMNYFHMYFWIIFLGCLISALFTLIILFISILPSIDCLRWKCWDRENKIATPNKLYRWFLFYFYSSTRFNNTFHIAVMIVMIEQIFYLMIKKCTSNHRNHHVR